MCIHLLFESLSTCGDLRMMALNVPALDIVMVAMRHTPKHENFGAVPFSVPIATIQHVSELPCSLISSVKSVAYMVGRERFERSTN